MRNIGLTSIGAFAGFLLLCPATALYTAQVPVTVEWDRGLGKGYAYNTDTSIWPFARIAKGNQPDQVTVTYQSPNSVVINWVVGDGQSSNTSGTLTRPNLTGVKSLVQYAPKNGSKELTASGFALTYDQNYNLPQVDGAQYNYTSGIINHVALTGLAANTEYYYRVGDGRNWSYPYEFTTLQTVNSSFQTYRIGIVADLGITDNSTTTFEHLTESLPDLVLLVGDWNYANNLFTNGTIAPSTYTGPEQTYQPVWDQFTRWWSTLASRTPFLAVPGNHEYEEQVGNKTFTAYDSRYNMTSDLSGSGTSRYYSVDLPGVHLVSLSPYEPYNQSSAQYAWLEKDLQKFDRTKTPWLIAQWHAPIYNSYVSHYKELECARLAWEPILYKYGVDLVLARHVHSYERSNRVYNYQNNACAPMYITIGDAGNLEQLAVPMADVPGNCPAIKYTSSPGSKFEGNCQWYSLQPENANTTNNGFCPTAQPSWSAYREASFGHGTLDVSPSSLLWSWHRNQDAEPVTSDVYPIYQKDASCPNLSGPAPVPAPSSLPTLNSSLGVSG